MPLADESSGSLVNDSIAQLDWIIIFVYLFGLIAFSAW